MRNFELSFELFLLLNVSLRWVIFHPWLFSPLGINIEISRSCHYFVLIELRFKGIQNNCFQFTVFEWDLLKQKFLLFFENILFQ